MTIFKSYLDNEIETLQQAGGGGGLTSGKYALFSQSSTVTSALSGFQPATLSQVLNTTAGDVTFDPLVDAAVMNIVTSGFYGVGLFGQWNIDSTLPETGQRQIAAVAGGAGLDNETAIVFNNLRSADIVGGATAADDAHLLQNVFRFGYIHAGTKFTARYANGDAVHTSVLAGFGISIARLA